MLNEKTKLQKFYSVYSIYSVISNLHPSFLGRILHGLFADQGLNLGPQQ